MSADRPLLGILLMVGFCLLAPLGDSLAKLLGQVMPLDLLLWTRFAIQAAILVPLVWLTGGSLRLSPRVLALTAVRTVLHILGIAVVFLALRHLPVAEAIAIAYVMPFLMLILGWAVLGEQVGPRRWAACVVGFGGTLMVVQPSFAEVGAPALLPVLVAVIFALFMLVTRAIAREAAPVTLQAVSGVMATVVLLPLDLSGVMGDWPLAAAPAPERWDWALLVGLGVLGTCAHLLMTWSLRFAPAATVAPMQYLEIPAATVIGWLIFRDFPNGLALAGIAVTMAAGLYVILRERRESRVKAPGPPV